MRSTAGLLHPPGPAPPELRPSVFLILNNAGSEAYLIPRRGYEQMNGLALVAQLIPGWDSMRTYSPPIMREAITASYLGFGPDPC